MPKYLIKVSQPTSVTARHIEESVRTIGSHFATRAQWQRRDGTSTGRLVIEAEDERWALAVVPPCMRASACVDRLEPQDTRSPFPAKAGDLLYPIAA